MLPAQPSANAEMSAVLKRSIHDHWGLFLGEGVILTVLGLAAIVVPPLAGLATMVFLDGCF